MKYLDNDFSTNEFKELHENSDIEALNYIGEHFNRTAPNNIKELLEEVVALNDVYGWGYTIALCLADEEFQAEGQRLLDMGYTLDKDNDSNYFNKKCELLQKLHLYAILD